jgi:hypothetical protein
LKNSYAHWVISRRVDWDCGVVTKIYVGLCVSDQPVGGALTWLACLAGRVAA